jgi:hypothetical protein
LGKPAAGQELQRVSGDAGESLIGISSHGYIVKSYHLPSSKNPINRINLNYAIDSTEDESFAKENLRKR